MVAVQRVSVVGNSGSGKTRLARRIAAELDVPHVELDSIYHLQNWEPIDADAFLAAVTTIASGEAWVVDGNYARVVANGPVWERAQAVVWLDLPRRTVLRQVTARTVRRIVLREELWNGNRESLRNALAWDPHRSIVRWAWTQHRRYRDHYRAAMRSAGLAHVEFVRLTSHAAAEAWLREIGRRGERTGPCGDAPRPGCRPAGNP